MSQGHFVQSCGIKYNTLNYKSNLKEYGIFVKYTFLNYDIHIYEIMI